MQVYLITEVLWGGELLDAVLERGSYSEADARLCFVQLLKGIEYLHRRWLACHLRNTNIAACLFSTLLLEPVPCLQSMQSHALSPFTSQEPPSISTSLMTTAAMLISMVCLILIWPSPLKHTIFPVLTLLQMTCQTCA